MVSPDTYAAHAIFEQAEAAVRGDVLLFSRVRRARNGLDRLTRTRKDIKLCYRGNDGTTKNIKSLLDASGAGKRLQESWPVWAKRYDKKAMDAVNAELAQHVPMDLPPGSVPEAFQGRSFYDFNASFFENHAPKAISFVADTGSPCGYASRIAVKESHSYNLPFAIGIYDQYAKKGLARKEFKKAPEKQGYNWYELGKVTIPKNGYVYITRAWTIQLPTSLPELIGNTYDILVSAKLSGPQFYPGAKAPDYIWIDRIILLESINTGISGTTR